MRFDLAEGLKTGFEAARYNNEPVVVAGFSLGATLAFDYAARASEWGVPAPRAVYSIFPVDPSLVDPALDVSTIEQTRVLVLVGADDHVVGQEGADELVNGLSGLPPSLKQLRVIRTSDGLLADHEAPTFVDNPVTQETFWTPLDDLIQKARSSNASLAGVSIVASTWRFASARREGSRPVTGRRSNLAQRRLSMESSVAEAVAIEIRRDRGRALVRGDMSSGRGSRYQPHDLGSPFAASTGAQVTTRALSASS